MDYINLCEFRICVNPFNPPCGGQACLLKAGQLLKNKEINCKKCEINILDFNSGMYWIIIDMVGYEISRIKFVIN